MPRDLMPNSAAPETDPIFEAAKPSLAAAVDLDALEALVPGQAATDNQLADKAFVNSTANALAAWKLYANATQGDFGTAAELTALAAQETDTNLVFYRADGQLHLSSVNDYALCLADETAPAPYTGQTTRWKKFADAGWGYELPLALALTAGQNASLNSGMTDALRQKLESLSDREFQAVPDWGNRSATNPSLLPPSMTGGAWTDGSPTTITKSGQYYFSAIVNLSSTPSMLFFRLRVNGNIVNQYGTLATLESTNRFRAPDIFFEAQAGDTVIVSAFAAAATTVAAGSQVQLTYVPYKTIEAQFQQFNDKGVVPTAADLPAAPSNFDLYYIVDSHKDVYARYVGGVLTWVDLIAKTQTLLGSAPDYDNGELIDIKPYLIPTGAAVNNNVYGAPYTIPKTGRYFFQANWVFSGAINGACYWTIRINGVQPFYWSPYLILTASSARNSLRNPLFQFDATAGDVVEFGLQIGTATTITISAGNLMYYPFKATSDETPALAALNAHVADTTVHVQQSDKDYWNNKQDKVVTTVTAFDSVATFDATGNLCDSGLVLQSNQSGQVKVRYTGLSLTGFTANTDAVMDVRSATAAESPAPTTLWPAAAVAAGTNNYALGFFIQGADSTADRFRENNVQGQVHRWRVAGNYSGKDTGDMGRLRCFLMNPDTGFKVSANAIMPAGITGDDFTFEFTSIADDVSLAAGAGYQIGFQTSYDDPNITITVNSIVRVSEAIDFLR